LKHWETRERKKLKEYEREKIKEDEKQEEMVCNFSIPPYMCMCCLNGYGEFISFIVGANY